MEKYRIVFEEDSKGKAVSYFHVERSEAHRIAQILTILPKLKQWTPLHKICAQIESKRLSTESTLLKMAGAKRIDFLRYGHRQIVARSPILSIRKELYNQRNNKNNIRFLRPMINVKSAQC